MDTIELKMDQMGAQLKTLREERKMTQEKAAAALHISTSSLKKYENGIRKTISDDILALMGELYGCELHLPNSKE